MGLASPPMNLIEKARLAQNLLADLRALLRSEGATNWIRGVEAALHSLTDEEPGRGFSEARSIYRTMSEGKGAFSDFYIERVDSPQRIEINQRLDEMRNKLWELFTGVEKS